MEHDLIDLNGDEASGAPMQDKPAQDEAFTTTFAAAEMALQSLKLAVDPIERASLNVEIKSLLDQAERLKQPSSVSKASIPFSTAGSTGAKKLGAPVSTRAQTKAEKILVLKSSSFNDCQCPPWKSVPELSYFTLEAGEPLFTEAADLSLSLQQKDHFARWGRPEDALPPPISRKMSDDRPSPPTMVPTRPTDFVQDVATDCSVVASLSAIMARVNRGYDNILGNIIYPNGQTSNVPLLSLNGKYIVKLNFNGSFRRVEIDDRLPISNSDRTIHVLDRNNPGLLWPPLIEKAYLKIRGGYDFPGSNSGTDLWVMTGWIPEQIFVQDETSSSDAVWRRILNAHTYGDVLITLGTGKISDREQAEIGLASEHDYAVLDLRESAGRCYLLVKNPWCEGPVFEGRSVSIASAYDSEESLSQVEAAIPSQSNFSGHSTSRRTAGTFWIDLHAIYQHFESIYLNWNPGLFSYRQDIHFYWSINAGAKSNILIDNPQLSLRAVRGEVVWLLLSKHFTDHMETVSAAGFIGLNVFDKSGARCMTSEFAIAKSPFVDSPQILLRLDTVVAEQTYTVVPVQDDISEQTVPFTLSAFSNSPLYLERAIDQYAYSTLVTGAWTEDTAGGNAGSPIYSQNPQYKLVVTHASQMAMVLDSHDSTVAVHIKLMHGGGKRVYLVRSRDVIRDSGDYCRGCAYAETTLSPGTYTIIVSTYEPNQQTPFRLRALSSSPGVSLTLIPREGAGRLRTRLATAAFQPHWSTIAVPILPLRLTKFSVLAVPRQMPGSDRSSSERSMIRLSLELGTSFDRCIIIASGSGEYSDSAAGVRTEEVDLAPELVRQDVLWLVLERMLTGRVKEEFFDVDIFYEAKESVNVGVWRCRDD